MARLPGASVRWASKSCAWSRVAGCPPTLSPSARPAASYGRKPTFTPTPASEDYPINESETPIAPLMYNAVGGSTIQALALRTADYIKGEGRTVLA